MPFSNDKPDTETIASGVASVSYKMFSDAAQVEVKPIKDDSKSIDLYKDDKPRGSPSK